MLNIILISSLISFIVTFYITPQFIRFFYSAKILAIDLHKKNKPKLPTSGGICVMFGVLSGLLTYIGVQTFVYNIKNIYLLAAISTILIATLVGLLDDIRNPIGKSNYEKKRINKKYETKSKSGLAQWIKPILTLPAAIPLMVVNAGVTTLSIPFIGTINFGIIYPLVLIPIGVVVCSNAVNLIGGFNGSEAGMGIVYFLSLAIYSYLHGINNIIFLSAAAALFAFLIYNWYPAKILPGDSLTYLLGSTVAAGVIIGNMEKAGVILMMPFIIEFFLKARSRFRASCLGILRKDGKLDPPYGKKIFSITHILMNIKKMTEKQVTFCLIAIEIFFGLILFFGIF